MLGTLTVVILLGGCLITSSNSLEESGTRVSAITLAQIVPRETTEAWLVATLGEPTERTVVAGQENVAVLKYEHVAKSTSAGTVFLLFAGGSTKRTVHATYFEVVNGVVTRHWTET
jgi:hypothetical protein